MQSWFNRLTVSIFDTTQLGRLRLLKKERERRAKLIIKAEAYVYSYSKLPRFISQMLALLCASTYLPTRNFLAKLAKNLELFISFALSFSFSKLIDQSRASKQGYFQLLFFVFFMKGHIFAKVFTGENKYFSSQIDWVSEGELDRVLESIGIWFGLWLIFFCLSFKCTTSWMSHWRYQLVFISFFAYTVKSC